MVVSSLEDVVQGSGNIVKQFRNAEIYEGGDVFGVNKGEYSNWIDEQRAWRESCILMDQSYQMTTYRFEGPDALRLNAYLGINDIGDLDPDDAPHAKQHPVCSPEGYLIGDPVLFQFSDGSVVVTGNRGLAQRWITYHMESAEYDVSIRNRYTPSGGSPPELCRFEVQGPNATPIVDEIVDAGVPELSFFEIEEITISGDPYYILAHGMASAEGYEIFGPYEFHDDLKRRIMDAGDPYSITEIGSKAYKTAALTTGWLPTGLPAVYTSDRMRGYREWLGTDTIEANWSLGGSYLSDDITDYYLDPVELGYGHFIDLDHEFVGRDPIVKKLDGGSRTKVTFIWDSDDVVDIFGSLFERGERHKYIQLPDTFQQWAFGHYDRVENNGRAIGLSLMAGFDYNIRAMVSIGLVESEYSSAGSQVSIVWGERHSQKATVEPHIEKEISAQIAPCPYIPDRNDM